MSEFDVAAQAVAVRTARFRHQVHGDMGEYGCSLRYVARSGDWDGDGWGSAERGALDDWERFMLAAPPLDRDPSNRLWWREQVWEPMTYRLLSTRVAVPMLDIAANVGGPHQAQVVLNRALRSCGYPLKSEDAPMSQKTLAAISNLRARDQELCLLVAMRSELAALYRAAATTEGLGHHLHGWLAHAYA